MKNALIIAAAILVAGGAISYAEQQRIAAAPQPEAQCTGSSSVAVHLDLPKLFLNLNGTFDRNRVGCLDLQWHVPTGATLARRGDNGPGYVSSR